MPSFAGIAFMIVVIMGISGSGKTTVGTLLARRLGWTYYEGDEFHSTANIEKMSRGIGLCDADRLPWLASLKRVIDDCVVRGAHAVIACSALRERYRRMLSMDVPEIRFVYLKGCFETIRERMNCREGHYMKAEMLESQLASLEEPDDAIVVDIEQSPPTITSLIESELGAIAGSNS